MSSLSSAVHAASNRLGQLEASISSLERQITKIQGELNADRAELLKLGTELNAAKVRLAQLEAFEAHAEQVLANQLVGSYESDQPDLITVVLDANGFQDLLERLAFAQRIRNQDVQVVSQVKAARSAVAAQAIKLGALEQRQQTVTEQVLAQRNSLAQAQETLIRQQLAVAAYRSHKQSQLASAQGQVASLRHQLSALLAAQAAAAAQRAAALSNSSPGGGSSGVAGSGPSGLGGTIVSGGGFTFPMPKGDAAPPGAWSLDDGVDISAPGGTPEVAVCSGTIVLHGIGGFGPWAPVLHCDSPIAGYSYVYYGHAGPANQLPIGTHVGAGQVMSEVGPGIVGISTGPHVEIGFCDSSGTPVGPASAPTMYHLLLAAYGA